MSNIKPKECPNGGKAKLTEIWKVVDREYIALRCSKQFCEEGNIFCITDYYENTEKGRESAIIDWNRIMCKKDGRN